MLADAGGEKYLNSKYDENKFLNEFILKSFKDDKENICEIDGDIAIVNGYAFELDRNVPKVGRYMGKEEDTLITKLITNSSVSNEKPTIHVEVSVRNKLENDKVVFLYKQENDLEYIEAQRGNDLSTNIVDLTIGKKYDIQVQIVSQSGEVKTTKNKKVLAGILVEKITLDKTTLSFEEGKNETLKVTSILPSNATIKDIIWKSSNTDIATVDSNGKIIALAAGETIITAKAADGGGAYASCKVTVKLEPISFVVNVSNIGDEGWAQSAKSTDGKDISKYTLTYYISTSKPASGFDTTDIYTNDTLVVGKNKKTNYFVWAVASGGDKKYASSNYYSVTTRWKSYTYTIF